MPWTAAGLRWLDEDTKEKMRSYHREQKAQQQGTEKESKSHAHVPSPLPQDSRDPSSAQRKQGVD